MQCLIDHPQLAARDRWREIGSPTGPLQALLPPTTFRDVELAMGAIPELGAHTELVLRELGYDTADVERLCEAGAAGRPTQPSTLPAG